MSRSKQKQNDISDERIPQVPAEITEEDIAQRAYYIYLARGAADGHALDDWLQAEQELRAQRSAAA